MSQLWPELLRITLSPDQVILEKGKLIISLKGVEHRYSDPEVIPVDPRHEPTLWAAPLAVLGIALDGLPDRRYDANVVLSNHFVHYPLVQSDAANADAQSPGVIEAELENALHVLLAKHDYRLSSVEPRMVAVATNHPDELQGEPGWLVLIEEGLACLGLIEDGEFTRLRNLYMWPASSVELLGVLDHEARQAGLERLPRTLLLWTRDEADEVYLPNNNGWHVLRLGKRQSTPMLRPILRDIQPFGARA